MYLPYEIQEKIITYLDYDDLVNYSTMNKDSIYICDRFLIMKSKIDDIPIELLPKKNITKKYVQFYRDRVWFNEYEFQYDQIKKKLTEIITNNDLNRTKWVSYLVIKSNILSTQKIDIIMTLSYFAFRNDKNEIFKSLLSILRNVKIATGSGNSVFFREATIFLDHINDIEYYLGILIDSSLELNKKDITFYLLEEFLDIIPNIKSQVLCYSVKSNHLDVIEKILNNYSISTYEYIEAIVDTNNQSVLKLLLSKYEGDKTDLNRKLTNHVKFRPSKNTLFLLLEYGFTDYDDLFFKIALSNDDNDENIEIIKNLLETLYQGKSLLKLDYIIFIFNRLEYNKIKMLLSDYLSMYKQNI